VFSFARTLTAFFICLFAFISTFVFLSINF
jgi:hypothetical protein